MLVVMLWWWWWCGGGGGVDGSDVRWKKSVGFCVCVFWKQPREDRASALLRERVERIFRFFVLKLFTYVLRWEIPGRK